MTTITISIADERLPRLQELAKEANVDPAELIRVSVDEWLSKPGEDFLRAATYVLRKNAELYKRLA